MSRTDPDVPVAFRAVPRTGVIFVTAEAARRGYAPGHPTWANLGQGQPEGGPLPGAPARVSTIEIPTDGHEYAPVAGTPELREAVARFYNRLFRAGRRSLYTADNVAISAGGRAGLTRIAAALGHICLGHFLPDYTAYEELLDIFRLFHPTPIALDADRGYDLRPAELEREIIGRGLGAILFSNPCNPTGRVVAGDDLAATVDVCRRLDTTLVLDEFYSHYVWTGPRSIVSAAEHVEDVDRDPVLILDGLTKNWRYPGWRIAWTVGPRAIIERIASAGSFLDGGASHPLQRAAVPLLAADHAARETDAIRSVFAAKRARLVERLAGMGLALDREPEGTFYAFVRVADLPPPLDTGMGFFRAALEERVICVPGEFFDVNPGKRRRQLERRFDRHVRLSFGPPAEEVETGCDRLEAMIGRLD